MNPTHILYAIPCRPWRWGSPPFKRSQLNFQNNRTSATAELRHASAVKIGYPEFNAKRQPDIEDMVSVCAGLATVDEESGIIRLVHYTTQEYFERKKNDWFRDAETDITKICVTYLSFSVFESGYSRSDEEFEKRLHSNPLYIYAAQNWGHHARVASLPCQEALDFLLCKAKVEASSQALIVDNRYKWNLEYSQRFPRNMTGLHLAAYFGVEEIVEEHHWKGAETDAKDTYGRTPLSWASRYGHEAVVQLLLEKGAAVDLTDEDGRTPLLRASRNGHEVVVKQLLRVARDGRRVPTTAEDSSLRTSR